MSEYESRTRQRSTSNLGAVAIVITILAVLIGFFVLRRVDRETDSVTSLGAGSRSAVGQGGTPLPAPTPTDASGNVVSTTAIAGPTTTVVTDTFTGTTVVVANANGTSGSAGKATAVLKNQTSFEFGTPTDAVESKKDLQETIVYYDSAQALTTEAVAKTLARILGGVSVLALPEDPVVDDAGGAGVILMLGVDLEGLTPNDLVPPLKAGEAADSAAATDPATADTAAP